MSWVRRGGHSDKNLTGVLTLTHLIQNLKAPFTLLPFWCVFVLHGFSSTPPKTFSPHSHRRVFVRFRATCLALRTTKAAPAPWALCVFFFILFVLLTACFDVHEWIGSGNKKWRNVFFFFCTFHENVRLRMRLPNAAMWMEPKNVFLAGDGF